MIVDFKGESLRTNVEELHVRYDSSSGMEMHGKVSMNSWLILQIQVLYDIPCFEVVGYFRCVLVEQEQHA